MTGVGISSHAVTAVDITTVLPPRARVVVLFISTVVHARTIYDHMWKFWYFILADFNRIIHWTVNVHFVYRMRNMNDARVRILDIRQIYRFL